jgi:hypothetical protein
LLAECRQVQRSEHLPQQACRMVFRFTEKRYELSSRRVYYAIRTPLPTCFAATGT